LRRLLLLVVGLVVAYVLLDLAARSFVSARVEDEFRESGRVQADDIGFRIDSFPFLLGLGISGELSATLHLEGVPEQGVTVDEFELELDGLRFDRDRAFRGHVLATSVDEATATLRFEEGTLSELLGVAVDIEEGSAQANGQPVDARMDGEDLVVGTEGVGEVTVPLATGRYLPCDPTVRFEPGVVELSCTTERLPPIVNQVIGQAVGRS
jgi:hypothetical protein